ncbi:MAG: TolQ protein [candidate division TM6 bacterium GW2011_GWF2_32_72]|nr:MAG: TolQ protein [candidate division TM6 bacterium GW2011_GWF2_32_72]
MLKFFLGNSIYRLVINSDFMSKLVLLILLLMSIVCWAVVFYKLILLRVKKSQLNDAIKKFQKLESFEQAIGLAKDLAGTLPGYLVTSCLSFYKSGLEGRSERKLMETDLEIIEYQKDQLLDDMIANEEMYLPILSTSAAVAPLLGLFGTIWGLIDSFVSISEKGSADIATIAPGIAEALLTTLAGLLVAIPALVMFHYLNLQVNKLERQFVLLSDKINLLARKLFVR